MLDRGRKKIKGCGQRSMSLFFNWIGTSYKILKSKLHLSNLEIIVLLLSMLSYNRIRTLVLVLDQRLFWPRIRGRWCLKLMGSWVFMLYKELDWSIVSRDVNRICTYPYFFVKITPDVIMNRYIFIFEIFGTSTACRFCELCEVFA